MTIEERVERLEGENRRLRRMLAAVCVTGVSVVLLGVAPEPVPEVVRAARFEVINDRGLVAAEQRRNGNGPEYRTRLI